MYRDMRFIQYGDRPLVTERVAAPDYWCGFRGKANRGEREKHSEAKKNGIPRQQVSDNATLRLAVVYASPVRTKLLAHPVGAGVLGHVWHYQFYIELLRILALMRFRLPGKPGISSDPRLNSARIFIGRVAQVSLRRSCSSGCC
jgi:hypothetical protein